MARLGKAKETLEMVGSWVAHPDGGVRMRYLASSHQKAPPLKLVAGLFEERLLDRNYA